MAFVAREMSKYECWFEETGEECAPTHAPVVIESDESLHWLSRVAEEFADIVWRSMSEGMRRDAESAGEMTVFVRAPNGWVYEFTVEIDTSPRFEAFQTRVEKTMTLPKVVELTP